MLSDQNEGLQVASDPAPRLGFVLHDVTRLLRKRFDQRAHDLGLTHRQWLTLSQLAQHEGLRQGGLAEILELEPVVLSRTLDRLETLGLADRRPDPADKRLWRIFLGPKAAAVLVRMRDIGRTTRSEALATLSEREQEQLMRLLSAVECNLTMAVRPESQKDGCH